VIASSKTWYEPKSIQRPSFFNKRPETGPVFIEAPNARSDIAEPTPVVEQAEAVFNERQIKIEIAGLTATVERSFGAGHIA
jgi:hypothetical protein